MPFAVLIRAAASLAVYRTSSGSLNAPPSLLGLRAIDPKE
jgi:hypothetical protein